MYLAYSGIVSCRKYCHDTIFLVTFVGYLLVGSGSFAFHASLKCMSVIRTLPSNHRACFARDLTVLCRPHAACRRAEHDLHDMLDVLCNFLLFQVKALLFRPCLRLSKPCPLHQPLLPLVGIFG